MTFTATAIILSVEKLNDKFFKVLLKDERENHILINIPVNRESELTLNSKISVWGNVSAFNYQNKWYNNLFAQTVVPESKKYILLQKVETLADSQQEFKILEFNSEPFSKEFILKKYNADLLKNKNSVDPKKVMALLKSKENVAEETPAKTENTPKNKCINVEYSHIQNAVSKNLVSIDSDIILVDKNTEFFIKKEGQSDLIIFYKSKMTESDIDDFI